LANGTMPLCASDISLRRAANEGGSGRVSAAAQAAAHAQTPSKAPAAHLEQPREERNF
jgi:hypothetical protein